MGLRVLTLVLLCAAQARAADACEKTGILLFPPPGAVIPTNAQLIIEGSGDAQSLVQNLLTTEGIALVPEAKEGAPPAIAVKAEKGFVSQMSRVAIRLRPLKPLEPNVEYSLALPRELAGIHLLNDRLKDGTLRWLAGVGPDKKAPKFKQRPASSEGFYVQDAQGLLRQLKLRTLVEENGPAFLVVSMQRARGGSTRQQYPVPIEGESFLIGHDACSGSFGFDDGRAYKLTFELFDAAGNKASEKPTLEVAAPRPLQ